MNRRRAWFVAKLAVSATLLFFLFSRLGSDALLRVVREASPWLPVAAVVMLTLQTALSTGKWFLLLCSQGIAIGYGSLLKTYLIGNFINLFMPSVVGGDAYRAVRISRDTHGLARALPSIILDRVTGIVALLVVGVTGLTLLLAPGRLWLVMGAVVLALYGIVRGPVRALCERLPPESYFGLARVAEALVKGLAPSGRLGWVIAISLVFQFNTVLINWAYSGLIGIDVPLTALLLIVPIVYLAEAVPVSINGLGVREATYAVMFTRFGLPAEQGILLGLTVSVTRYVAGLIGGLLLAVDVLRPSSGTRNVGRSPAEIERH